MILFLALWVGLFWWLIFYPSCSQHAAFSPFPPWLFPPGAGLYPGTVSRPWAFRQVLGGLRRCLRPSASGIGGAASPSGSTRPPGPALPPALHLACGLILDRLEPPFAGARGSNLGAPPLAPGPPSTRPPSWLHPLTRLTHPPALHLACWPILDRLEPPFAGAQLEVEDLCLCLQPSAPGSPLGMAPPPPSHLALDLALAHLRPIGGPIRGCAPPGRGPPAGRPLSRRARPHAQPRRAWGGRLVVACPRVALPVAALLPSAGLARRVLCPTLDPRIAVIQRAGLFRMDGRSGGGPRG